MDNPYIHDWFSCINCTCDREFFILRQKLANKVGAKLSWVVLPTMWLKICTPFSKQTKMKMMSSTQIEMWSYVSSTTLHVLDSMKDFWH